MRVLANRRHREYEETLEWVGDEWTPEAFDVDAADRLVMRHKPQPGRRRGRGAGRQGARA